MPTSVPALPPILDGKEGIMNPREIGLDSVDTVLGKGNMVTHFRSQYRKNKNFPTHFEYIGMDLNVVLAELGKYKVSPKFAGSREHVRKIMRDSSMLVTDTYVIELPGDVFVIYQLGTIRDLYQGKIRLSQIKPKFEYILGGIQVSPYDDSGLGRPDGKGFDDTGRLLQELDSTDLSILSGGSDRITNNNSLTIDLALIPIPSNGQTNQPIEDFPIINTYIK